MDEPIIWGHEPVEGYRPPQPTRLFPSFIPAGIVFWLLFTINAVLFALTNGMRAAVAVVVAGAFIGLWLRTLGVDMSLTWKPESQPPEMPAKLTQTRLQLSEGVIPVADILRVRSDICQGSPALLIETPDRTHTLISSDIAALRRALYSLRPELETTP
ncbi:MAG: hypothetical protein WBF53_14610 [Litorimonas sp.]